MGDLEVLTCPDDAPAPLAVALARELLQLCEAGDIQALAIVAHGRDGTRSMHFCPAGVRPFVVLGLATKQLELVQASMEEGEDQPLPEGE